MQPSDRRKLRSLATRQKISDAATRLFMENGFDAVTVDQIAAAAQVSRMTVFNHFARKEDMLFDLDDEGRQDILQAIQEREPGMSPVEALRHFAHRAVAERKPYVLFCESGADRFVETVRGSEALLARVRVIRDELSHLVADAMAKSAGLPRPDRDARLAGALLVSTWAVAFVEAHQAFHHHGDAGKAYQVLLDTIDRGSRAVAAGLQGTAYA